MKAIRNGEKYRMIQLFYLCVISRWAMWMAKRWWGLGRINFRNSREESQRLTAWAKRQHEKHVEWKMFRNFSALPFPPPFGQIPTPNMIALTWSISNRFYFHITFKVLQLFRLYIWKSRKKLKSAFKTNAQVTFAKAEPTSNWLSTL